MSESNEFEMLEDLRARVIFYSCLAEPKNILEISKLWNYRTSTYFYQKRSKEIIQEMEAKELISSIKGARFESNYDMLLKQSEVTKFFEKTNHLISNQIIIEKFEWEVIETQLEDPLFREFCLEKRPELKEILRVAEMTNEDVETLLSLWKTHLFRKVFLSADHIKRLIKDRQQLPQNPRQFIFSLTMHLCEAIYLFKREKNREFTVFEFPNPYLWLDVDEIMPLVANEIKSTSSELSEELESFTKSFRNVYRQMVKKFKPLEDRAEVSTYHISKFVELVKV